jgi:hypothetical protein
MTKIIINPLTGNKFFISYNYNESINDFKLKIAKKINISKNNFFLAYNNKKINSLDKFINLNEIVINIIPYKNNFQDDGIAVYNIIL